MATIINASSTNGLVMTSDLSGVLTLQQNGVALPNGGVAPAFSAYQSSAQTLSATTTTKLQFQTKEFDTNNNFDNVTNFRFTPTVAGYYQVSGGWQITVTPQWMTTYIYKNGSSFKIIFNSYNANTNGGFGSCLVYMNGSTDYIEMWGSCSAGATLNNSVQTTYFQACLVRGA
jgi:hypothetical protein